MTREIQALIPILDTIYLDEQMHGPRNGMEVTLEGCKEPLEALRSMAADLAVGFSSSSKIRRHWTAIEFVKKSKPIDELKRCLNSAKLTIIMAQTTALFAGSHQQICTASTDTPDRQTIALREDFPYLAPNPFLSGQRTNAVLETIPSKMRRRVTTSPPLQNTSVDSEFHSTQTCESSAVEYGRHISREVPTIVLTGSLAKAGLARFKRLRQIRSTQWTTIPVLWGELRYSKTTYMVRQPWDVDDDKGFQSKTPVQFESKTTVKFIPYWWTVKMGMNRALEINNQCWKTNLDVYRLVPNTSMIFDFCRDGNLDAVRLLLGKGEASIYDINELGETLLHVAAGACRTDICALLLEAGADQKMSDCRKEPRTPFGRACSPGATGNVSHQLADTYVPYPDLMATLRLFVRHGEDFEESHYLFDLMRYEGWYEPEEVVAKRPTLWILEDVLPSLDHYSHSNKWWQRLLLRTWRWPQLNRSARSYLLPVLSYCATAAIRVNLLYLIFDFKGPGAELQHDMRAEFETLVGYSGGLCFLQSFFGKVYSPISAAMQCAQSFTTLRQVLQDFQWDLREIVQDEVQLWDDGWTEETMMLVFATDFDLLEDNLIKRCKLGDHCGMSLYLHWDYPFQKIVRRIKLRLNPDDMPDEVETQHQIAWDEVLQAYEDNICYYCWAKRNLHRFPFLPGVEEDYDDPVEIYKAKRV